MPQILLIISQQRNVRLNYRTTNMTRFFLLFLAFCWPGLEAGSDMRIVRQWAQLDYKFPSEDAKQSAIDRGFYVPSNPLPIDVQAYYKEEDSEPRIFMSSPRSKVGTPITFGTVDEKGQISAYPDYSWHDNQGENCDGLTSVFRVAIDQCDRLWVIDNGKVAGVQRCPPQLLAFDLATDELVYRHRFNKSSYIDSSFFITPVVDVRSDCPGDCDDTMVYVADENGFALMVVDPKRDLSWRITHRLFYPYPSRGSFVVDGESFDRMDGLIGMALSPYKKGEDRFLYFHTLASTTENVVRASYLRNDSFIENSAADPKALVVLPSGERPNQSAGEGMDSNGVLYFGLMDPPSIWCWNSATEYSPRNFHLVAEDQETLQFASGVKIVKTPKGKEELWVMTCSFQRSVTGTMSPDEINFRIHSMPLENFTCGNPPKDQSMGYQANLLLPK